MFSIVANIVDLATNDLQRMAARVESRDINAIIGRAGTNEVQDHFTKLDSDRPNKLGGVRTHFYAEAAASTHWTEYEGGVRIETDNPVGLRQRMFGGLIRSEDGKLLTIPAIAEAYGHSAGEFDNLVPMYRRRDGVTRAVALVESYATPTTPGKRRKDGTASRGAITGGRVYYWLVEQVVQDADPTVVPNEQAVLEKALAAVDQYFGYLQGDVEA